MKKDYFKDGNPQWILFLQNGRLKLEKVKMKILIEAFYQLQDSFARFKVELIKKGYKGYFSND
jgi:hypothetical protein